MGNLNIYQPKRRRRIWSLVLVVVCAVALLSIQGCCKCKGCPDCPPPRVVTHTVAIAENLLEHGCTTPTCVCPLPTKVSAVRGGDQILWVNTTPYAVHVQPADANVLSPAGNIDIPPKGSATSMVKVNHGYGSGAGFGVDFVIESPGTNCPALPGPSIEFD